MTLADVRKDVRKWRYEIASHISQQISLRQVAVASLMSCRSGDVPALDRMVVLIADIKEIDTSVARLRKLDQIYQDKLDTAVAHDKNEKAEQKAARATAQPIQPLDHVSPDRDGSNRPEFVRFADIGSDIQHPSPLPVPVVTVEEQDTFSSSHYLTDEIDRRASATMRWAPWERRKHARRRYEGFSVVASR